jgi:hypothetical protein
MNGRRIDRTRRGNGRSRALAGIAFGLVAGATTASHAQLEVLLRGLDPAPPRAGACGRYRFEADEPSGRRRVEFEACIERVGPGPDGSVFLRLTSGDSLDARLELAPALFAGHGGSLLEHIRSVVEIAGGDTTRLSSHDWAALPGLDPAPPLPGARDSLLGGRDLQVGTRTLQCRGRRVHEESRSVRPLGDVQMTQAVWRDVETWTTDAAPVLGVVRATARIRTERSLSARVAGIPESGPKSWAYALELLEVRPPRRGAQRRRGSGRSRVGCGTTRSGSPLLTAARLRGYTRTIPTAVGRPLLRPTASEMVVWIPRSGPPSSNRPTGS